MESRLNVERWQTARPQWNYTPVMWFYYRMVEVAYLDATAVQRAEGPLRPEESLPVFPTNDGLIARDWIATSEQHFGELRSEFVSFPECCQHLGLNADVERLALLERIDTMADFDDDCAWQRLEAFGAIKPKDDTEPLFDALRVVPAIDQLMLFAA